MELIDEHEDNVEVQMSIGELFEKIEKLKNIKFSDKTDDEIILGTEHQFKVKNEHNEWIDVLGLVTKFDSVRELKFDSGSSFKAAENHLLSYDGLHTKFLHEYKAGDKIVTSNCDVEIITSSRKQNKGKKEKVYDLQVASDTHLYQTSNGLIHHNSVGLINLSWNYVQQGKDVVYISLELNESKVMKRFITHSARIPTWQIPTQEMEIYNHIRSCDSKGFGRFTVHFYQPNTLTSMKLELFIRNYIQKYGTVPIIVLDYAGLMIPNGKNWQGMFERDKYVSEELRGVATLFDTVVWTADQYNRCCEINELVQTKQGKIEIGKLKKGDRILGTNNEWRVVTEVSDIEEQEVYEITTKSGKKIMVSNRHIFPKDINGKMVEDNILTSLKVGDKLYVKEGD